MYCYVDTSVLVALCTNEPDSAQVDQWYAREKHELVSASWCMTEFASALCIKQRTSQLTGDQAHRAWEHFKQLCSQDINLLAIDPNGYFDAANLILDAQQGLRAGDALHLVCARNHRVHSIATLDKVMAQHAKKLKIKSLLID